ncbi:MAG: SRPBCC family protein [Acidobacteria bacterium]|nr:SRPBCC family protein [Acidobacteriota bacterium]MCW5947922.1 SRPBCC family protein [Pyrinomonadaceae bacterium]
MTEYHFETIWELEAEINAVWDLIEDADAWPEWWRGVVESREIRKGDADGIGSLRVTRWRSVLPYTLEFETEVVAVDRLRRIEIVARGELNGRGIWLFDDKGGVTEVRYLWTVRTEPRWMNLIAPIARPVFRWNHDAIMRQGELGLRMRLGPRS